MKVQASENALDRSEWDRAFRVHHHRVVVSLIAAGVRADRAMEIAQAAWTRLLEQDASGRLDRAEMPGLALTQARFLAMEAHRRERKDQKRSAPESEADEVVGAEDPERSALVREEMAEAVAIIAASSPTAQRVFQLAYGIPPLSHAEVAVEVGISLQRVRQVLCELRKKIREALEAHDS